MAAEANPEDEHDRMRVTVTSDVGIAANLNEGFFRRPAPRDGA